MFLADAVSVQDENQNIYHVQSGEGDSLIVEDQTTGAHVYFSSSDATIAAKAGTWENIHAPSFQL